MAHDTHGSGATRRARDDNSAGADDGFDLGPAAELDELDVGDSSTGSDSTPTAEPRTRQGRGGRRHSGNEPFHITADRPIFTLSVAADLLGLHPRTLRIYEEKKLVVPSRTEGNRRRYSQRDIERFQFIRYLTSGGVNLEGVRIILDMADELRRLGGDPSAVIERNLPNVND